MLNLEDKCQTMQLAIDRFMVKFEILRQKGVLNPLVINVNLMTQEDYNKRTREVARDQVNTSSMKGIPTGKLLYQTSKNLFYL